MFELEKYNGKMIKVITIYGKTYTGECIVEYDEETGKPHLEI